jgi:DNA-binding response OmpR family regulator
MGIARQDIPASSLPATNTRFGHYVALGFRALTTPKQEVLIVEDEPLVALLLEDMLIDLGHQVVRLCGNFSDGLRAAKDLEVSLAVLDVNLQGQLSFPIADAARDRGIAVLFVTGFGDGSMPELQEHVVLAKPYTTEDLARAIVAATQGGGTFA